VAPSTEENSSLIKCFRLDIWDASEKKTPRKQNKMWNDFIKNFTKLKFR